MSLIKSFGGFVKSARYLISLANKYYVDTESDEELEYIKKLEEVITENPMIVVSKYGNFLCVHNDQIEDTSFYNIESDYSTIKHFVRNGFDSFICCCIFYLKNF